MVVLGPRLSCRGIVVDCSQAGLQRVYVDYAKGVQRARTIGGYKLRSSPQQNWRSGINRKVGNNLITTKLQALINQNKNVYIT